VGRGARFAVAQGHPRGQRIVSLKSPCWTWTSIETIAINCLLFEKTAFCPNYIIREQEALLSQRRGAMLRVC